MNMKTYNLSFTLVFVVQESMVFVLTKETVNELVACFAWVVGGSKKITPFTQQSTWT